MISGACARAAARAWPPARPACHRRTLFNNEQICAEIDGIGMQCCMLKLLATSAANSLPNYNQSTTFEPKIVGFLCNWCS